ncbi:HAD family hydrolase [Prevotella sp. KH2C16]|uniref:KdsC family phosphatase n=1 Tax=Prevotella sp. KH2C16 TaxID=1855325 RepID=UPI0008F1A837|nr:HAD family hydrolase [Prevotella sp. KH2C16]SFF99657.1 3-deoxy-D-manno-octulosonate 8-phosphate phosphatase (KDO 8-P phosphatase) [Prevotella sp. KH2C16]
MINFDLKEIRAVIFDIDGVLSANTINMDGEGQPLRTLNIKDGYAIQLAQKMGLRVAILTGGHSEAIEKRYRYLGVEDIYMHCSVKVKAYHDFLDKHGLKNEEILYMGDDIPDFEVMSLVGCPCCPRDAAQEIKDISLYVSDLNGGYGCGRDVIEQVLKAQGKWLNDAKAFGW